MYFFYFLYKIPKNIYKDRSRTGLGTDLYTVLGPSNGPVQSSPGQKTGLLGPGPDRTGPIHLYLYDIFVQNIISFPIKNFDTEKICLDTEKILKIAQFSIIIHLFKSCNS